MDSMNRTRRIYKKPTIRELNIDHQTSMILQSPPPDPPDIELGFLRLKF